MNKSIEVSGKTEEEAIELALVQLGLTRDDVSVEILERAKSGFLGLKSTPAVIKVLYEAKEERTERVEGFLGGLFERMGVEVTIEVTESDDTINVALASKEPGVLIGRRGETLDAVQHLTNYAVNRGNSSRVRVNLDAENYRKRRNETLESLAAKTAERVLKYRRNMTLDPMNAYERHVIHAALQDHGSVSTYSVGSEPNRRIVVAYGEGSSSGRGGGKSSESRYGSISSRGRSDRPRGSAGSRSGGWHNGSSDYSSRKSYNDAESTESSSAGEYRYDNNSDDTVDGDARTDTTPYREWQ